MDKKRAILVSALFFLFISISIYVILQNEKPPVISTENAEEIDMVVELTGNTNAVYCLDWSTSGDLLASGAQDGTVFIWDTENWKEEIEIKAYRGSVWGVAFNPEGSCLATAGAGGGVKLWNIGDYDEADKIEGQSFWAFTVDWSLDGDAFVAGYSNGDVTKYSLEGEQDFFGEHEREVITVVYSPDGLKVATGSIDYKIIIWDAETGNTLNTLIADTMARNDINGLEWSPDNIHLAASCQDGFVRIWNTETGTVTSQRGSPYNGWKRGLSWSLDGSILAYAGEDCSVVLWDIESDMALVELRHNSPVWDVVWSPDGRYIASGSGFYGGAGDTRVIIWAISE